jgi:DNA-binding MarR family transcriptional regulator
VLALAGEGTQSQLGEMLAMDSTTLTRTLQIMIRQGWIAERRGEDRRERWLRLAKAGEAQFKRALPTAGKKFKRASAVNSENRPGKTSWNHTSIHRTDHNSGRFESRRFGSGGLAMKNLAVTI